MKKVLILCALSFSFLATSFEASAQKFAYVDTEYILEKIPAYQEAQKQLDEISAQWQQEIESKFEEVDRLYKAYVKEQILLTEDLKKKREDEIVRKEKEAKDLQKAKFGVDGELFVKRQELIKPIQDEIYTSIKEISSAGSYAVIFDKASSSNILFANPRYDKSDDVLRKMGVDPASSSGDDN